MSQAFNTTVGLTANVSSAGQPVDFDAPVAGNVVIGNGSGQSIQYSVDSGANWTTVANAASITIAKVRATSAFRLRKTTSDSYPVPVAMSWIAGGADADSIGSKLRRLAAAAAVSNPVANLPLTVPSAWTAATAYAIGNVVTNGGNQYICYTAGTSAGSGGPSGTGAALITDNTVSWHYYGKARISANSPLAPTLTYVTGGTTPSSLTNYYAADLNRSKFVFGGGTPTSANFNWVVFPSVTLPSGGNITSTQSCYSWTATFETDAPKVAIGTNNGTTPSRFIIDGQYFYDGGDSSNGGNPAWRVFDFGGVRKVRRYTIEGPGAAQFAGVVVDAQSQIWAPSLDQVKVAVLGSSIEAGGNSYPIMGSSAWCMQVGKLLGWSDVRNLGIGGTGYVTSGGLYNYTSHLSDATSFSPDIVIVGGPINDSSGSALQAAALSLFQQIRAALPNAIIIACGTYPAATGPSAGALASEANISAAVGAFGDANTFFIPIASDPLASWISGTGKVSSTTGTGNADVYISSDGTHPTQSGIDYFAGRMATAVRQIVLPALNSD